MKKKICSPFAASAAMKIQRMPTKNIFNQIIKVKKSVFEEVVKETNKIDSKNKMKLF